MQLDSGMSISRYLPAMGAAGVDRILSTDRAGFLARHQHQGHNVVHQATFAFPVCEGVNESP